MGAGGFHGRVRDGIGCGPSAMATRSSKPKGQVLLFVCGLLDECCGGLADALASAWGVEPIGRLGPVGTGIAAVAPLAYRRAGLARPSGRPGFEGGFPLRCFQRLSSPHIATRPCRWRDNRFTRGASIPVLSY